MTEPLEVLPDSSPEQKPKKRWSRYKRPSHSSKLHAPGYSPQYSDDDPQFSAFANFTDIPDEVASWFYLYQYAPMYRSGIISIRHNLCTQMSVLLKVSMDPIWEPLYDAFLDTLSVSEVLASSLQKVYSYPSYCRNENVNECIPSPGRKRYIGSPDSDHVWRHRRRRSSDRAFSRSRSRSDREGEEEGSRSPLSHLTITSRSSSCSSTFIPPASRTDLTSSPLLMEQDER